MHKCGWNPLYNAIRALVSLQKVTSLWINKPKYDIYLYLRSDINYTIPLDIDTLKNNINKNVFIQPSFMI